MTLKELKADSDRIWATAPVYAEAPIRLLNGEQAIFQFKEAMAPPKEGDVWQPSEARRLMLNYVMNLAVLSDRDDIHPAAKADLVIVARQQHIQKFIEMGVPEDVAWALHDMGRITEAEKRIFAESDAAIRKAAT